MEGIVLIFMLIMAFTAQKCVDKETLEDQIKSEKSFDFQFDAYKCQKIWDHNKANNVLNKEKAEAMK